MSVFSFRKQNHFAVLYCYSGHLWFLFFYYSGNVSATMFPCFLSPASMAIYIFNSKEKKRSNYGHANLWWDNLYR